MAKRIITTENLEEDSKIEGQLRPQLLSEYIGQEKAKKTLEYLYRSSESKGRSTWIMCCFTDRRDLVRQHLQESLRMRWV